ncbi:MAG: hypothetical protein V4864_20650 [Pseudomonadota bacterium]
MSDLSGQRHWQSMALSPPKHELSANELRFHRLKSPREIAEIAPLRRQIPLPASVQAAPLFAELEKKETNWAWSGHLNMAVGSLAPCALSQ